MKDPQSPSCRPRMLAINHEVPPSKCSGTFGVSSPTPSLLKPARGPAMRVHLPSQVLRTLRVAAAILTRRRGSSKTETNRHRPAPLPPHALHLSNTTPLASLHLTTTAPLASLHHKMHAYALASKQKEEGTPGRAGQGITDGTDRQTDTRGSLPPGGSSEPSQGAQEGGTVAPAGKTNRK